MLLEIRDLEVRRGGTPVVRDLSLNVKRGEVLAVLGANGAGKTTLLNSLAGFLRPHRGEVLIEGVNATGFSPEQMVRLGVSLVPEGREIFAGMTVLDNLVLGAYSRCLSKKKIPASLEEVIDIFPPLGERLKELAGSLSGGLQQMLAIGRALMSGPRLLLLDEPSAGLSPLAVRSIQNALAGLKARGLSVILVEQNPACAALVADRVVVMEGGRAVLEGLPGEFTDMERVRRVYLGRCPQRAQRN